MLMIFVMLLIVAAVFGGGWGYKKYAWAGVSPAVAVLLVVGLLYFTGNLHFR